MKNENILALILHRLQQEISSDSVKERFRTKANCFVRRRTLTFPTLVYMRLNLMNKSLSVELGKYLKQFGGGHSASKQAFSKAVSQIKWEGFEYFNDFFVKDFYNSFDYQRFKGKYLLCATDGSTFQLPYLPALVSHFGVYNNTQMEQGICMGLSVKLYDVLNRITICTGLNPYYENQTKGNSEQAVFEQHLDKFHQLIDPTKRDVVLLADKYYPNFYYFDALPAQGINFIFRCKPNFCSEVTQFAQSGQLEQYITIDLTKSQRKYNSSARRLDKNVSALSVRCVRIDRGTKEAMFLLTNLNEQQLSRTDLSEAYQLRWGEETSFDYDKNTLEMENFSAQTVNGVLQEFYAKTLTANLAAVVIEQAQQQLDIEQSTKSNKHNYQINRKVAIGLLKDEIVPFLNGSEAADQWIERIVKLILPHRSPVRSGRNFPKKRKHKLKFSMNLRRVT